MIKTEDVPAFKVEVVGGREDGETKDFESFPPSFIRRGYHPVTGKLIYNLPVREAPPLMAHLPAELYVLVLIYEDGEPVLEYRAEPTAQSAYEESSLLLPLSPR